MTNAVTRTAPVQTGLTTYSDMLNAMPLAVLSQAEAMVTAQIAESNSIIPAAQKRSMVIGTALDLTQAISFVDALTRWKLAKVAREENLAAVSPVGTFATTEAYLARYKMAQSEESELNTLFGYVFPWLEEEANWRAMGFTERLSASDLWVQIGKAKMRTLAGYFSVAIQIPTLQDIAWSDAQLNRRTQIETLAAASELGIDMVAEMTDPTGMPAVNERIRAHIASQWPSEPAQRNPRMMRWLIEQGTAEGATFSSLRSTLRPTPMNVPTVSFVTIGDNKFVILPVNAATEDRVRAKFTGFPLEDVDLTADNVRTTSDHVPFLMQLRNILGD